MIKETITVQPFNSYGQERYKIVSEEHFPLQQALKHKSLDLLQIKQLKQVGFKFSTAPAKEI